MSSWNASVNAPEANRLFYEGLARDYDDFEECIVAPRARARLRRALVTATELAGPEAVALDACGGTGQASAMLLELGAEPVTVDVSPDMLEVWRAKARALGHEPQVVESEILAFLRADRRAWDLIVFSSALHHLADHLAVVRMAARRLRAGGVLVTVFDPTPVGTLGRVIRRLDYPAYVVLKHPRKAVDRVLAKMRRARTRETNIGRMAELHAESGLDDDAIRRVLEEEQMEIVVHERLYEARLSVLRWLLRMLRMPSNFSFIARRTPGSTVSGD